MINYAIDEGSCIRMKTNVSIIINSEGGIMSEVAFRFEELGFKPTLGMHDFIYKWDEANVTPEKIIDLADKVQEKLRGLNVGLHFMTD